MQIKSVPQYSGITGKTVENIRQCTGIYKERLPIHVFYNGEYHELDDSVLCVIFGDGAPLTKYTQANILKREIKLTLKDPESKKEAMREYRRQYHIKNPQKKLESRTRSLIYNSFKRACNGKYKKSEKSEFILGCKMADFINHISSKFIDGMTLGNYGLWHIDHIKPFVLAKNESDIFELCHYTNLQPLWAKDNLRKGAKT